MSNVSIFVWGYDWEEEYKEVAVGAKNEDIPETEFRPIQEEVGTIVIGFSIVCSEFYVHILTLFEFFKFDKKEM